MRRPLPSAVGVAPPSSRRRPPAAPAAARSRPSPPPSPPQPPQPPPPPPPLPAGRAAADDLPLGEALGDLVEEARRDVVLRRAPQRPRARVHEVQPVHRARDAHVGEAALLLHVLLVQRALVREHALLHAGDEHHRELEALGVVQRHQREQRAGVGERVAVAVQRDLLQEAVEAGLVGALVVLGGHADELLDVLEAALGLERLLRREGRLVAGLVEDAAHDLGDGPAGEAGLQALDDAGEGQQAVAPRRPTARARRRRPAALVQRLSPTLAACACRRCRLVAPMPRLGVLTMRSSRCVSSGFTRTREVGDEVADLGALVELGPADDLVGDRVAPELLLEHAALRVGAVEHGDLVRPVGPLGALASPSSSFCTSLATNCASARSSLTSTTWTSAPSPLGVHRFLPLRLRLWVTTALATSRIFCVER